MEIAVATLGNFHAKPFGPAKQVKQMLGPACGGCGLIILQSEICHMSWKIENWMEDVFPGEIGVESQFDHLSTREFIISISASLDLALVQLLSLRIIDNKKESEDFLGLNGDGRAPCGSFGSRIQLSLLLGIISQEDADLLRLIKGLRNLFAHSVNVHLTIGDGAKIIIKLFEHYKIMIRRLREKDDHDLLTQKYEEIRNGLSKSEDLCRNIINTIYIVYQIYFHRIISRVIRIDKASKFNIADIRGKSE